MLDVSGDLPKSFVVCDHPYHPQIVYLSQLNTSTLKNRAESEQAGTVRQMGRAGNGLPLNRSKQFLRGKKNRAGNGSGLILLVPRRKENLHGRQRDPAIHGGGRRQRV